jgi:hypothetical protein
MSKTAYAAVDAWYAQATGKSAEEPEDCFQIITRGDVLYSYGTHFELARPLRNKSGKIQAWLLNGDTYSQTTSAHQSHVRWLLSDEQTVIIPHEALNSAGIDLETVQIVHVKPDSYTTTHHRTAERPPRSKWVDHPIHKHRRLTDTEVNAELDKRHAEAMRDYNSKVSYRDEAIAKGDEVMTGVWNNSLERMGGLPVRPDKLPESAMTRLYVAGHDRKLHPNGREWGDEITVTTLPDGTVEYSWSTNRHWLGESLIRARVTWQERKDWPKRHHRWAYYLSGFDHEEARPLYFFAELPRGAKPTTVAEAYEALKPDPVKMAEQMNRPIFRQGDIFGVPTRLDRKALRAMGARIERRRMAEVEIAPVMREVTPANLPYVLHTNHTATEVAYLPGGVTLARGTMYHDPEGRRADHARRRIGDGKAWHIVIKNTVPIASRR